MVGLASVCSDQAWLDSSSLLDGPVLVVGISFHDYLPEMEAYCQVSVDGLLVDHQPVPSKDVAIQVDIPVDRDVHPGGVAFSMRQQLATSVGILDPDTSELEFPVSFHQKERQMHFDLLIFEDLICGGGL